MHWTAAIVESPTEQRNPRTAGIDELDTQKILQLINTEDRTVAPAVGQVLNAVARAVDQSVDRIRRGGRIHYFGAGTSGRLAAADAAELPPTFNAPPCLFVAHAADSQGEATGDESAEDDEERGRRDAGQLDADDVALGVTASGRTPYVRAALAAAGGQGALTVLLTSNPTARLAASVDITIAPDTGPEVIAGSTRMKAGTAQKLVLNAYSTTVMIRLGHTWSNLMVSVEATNEKLRGRAVRILREATDASEDRCRATLTQADGNVKAALVALLAELEVPAAEQLLRQTGGSIREALSATATRQQR